MLFFEKIGNKNGEELEEAIRRDNKIKLRVGFLMIIFLFLIIFFARNKFDFDVSSLKTSLIDFEVECNKEYNYSKENNLDKEIQKAKKVINANLIEFQQMRGFREIYVEEFLNEKSYLKEPVIRIRFEGVSETDKLIPNKICDFKTIVIFK